MKIPTLLALILAALPLAGYAADVDDAARSFFSAFAIAWAA